MIALAAKTRRIGFLFAVLSIGLASPSQAGVVFTLGNNPQPGEDNVLLNNGTTGNTVFGLTQQTATLVQFSSSQTLSEPANGQARIEATNGTSQVALTDVTISVPGGFFGDLIFNPTITGTIGTSGGTATVTAITNVGTPFTYTLGNGNNFLTITTTGGDLLSSVSISYPDGFTDLRQIRISGLTAAIPEPASAVLGAIGLVSLASIAAARRSRTRSRAA